MSEQHSTMSSFQCACDVCLGVSRPRTESPLDESLQDAQRIAGLMVEQVQELAKRVEALQAENRVLREQWAPDTRALHRVREVLSAFVHAPISISSLQPVLDLAQELGCALRRDE